MKKLSILFAFALLLPAAGVSFAADRAAMPHPEFKADLSGAEIPPVATTATGEAVFELMRPVTGAGTGGVGSAYPGYEYVEPGDVTTGLAAPGLGGSSGSAGGGIGQTSDPGTYSGIVNRPENVPANKSELDSRRNYSSSNILPENQPGGMYNGSGAGGKTPGRGIALEYQLNLSDIKDVTAAHLHMGKPTDSEGPVVASLFLGPKKAGDFSGTLAQGMITDKDLSGPLKGKKVDDLVSLMKAGDIYVNVHTAKHPSGEIRGEVHDVS